MNVEPTIKLTIKPNSHRLAVAFGDRVRLFCSARASVTEKAVVIAGIKIVYLSWLESGSGNVFEITASDAARLINRLSRPAYDAALDFACPSIAHKWEARIEFEAEDFVG